MDTFGLANFTVIERGCPLEVNCIAMVHRASFLYEEVSFIWSVIRERLDASHFNKLVLNTLQKQATSYVYVCDILTVHEIRTEK